MCAIVAGVIMVVSIYGLYDVFDAFHSTAAVRRLLAWAGFLSVVGPSLGVLFGVPFLAARWWRTSAIVGLVVAGILAGLAADRVLFELSLLNDCGLDHAFPYDIAGCD